MKSFTETDVNDVTFDKIAEEFNEKPKTIWECHKRALNKLEIILKQKGYTKEDFFGAEK
jgi:hypothetical protein